MSRFKVGDIVKHTALFLKSTGYITNVPVDGKVMKVDECNAYGTPAVLVQWCDSKRPYPILEEHIMLASEPDTSGM